MSAPPYNPLRELGPATRNRIYAELQEKTPVYWSPIHAAWILTRYADVNAILQHPNALALDGLQFVRSISERGKLDLSGLLAFLSSIALFTRPPSHEPLRHLLAQAVSGIWRLNLPERLGGYADRLLEMGEHNGVIDLAAGYGKALALFVIGSFLGIPEDDLQELSGLATDLVAVFERAVPSIGTLIKLNNCATALLDYFSQLINLRRQCYGDDGVSLISRLADTKLGCSTQELAGYCAFFFMAAEETTAAAISESALLLLELPELRAQLSRDASRVPNAVRELLRLISPVQYVARQMTVDIRVRDQPLRAGQAILLMLGAANRDPAAFPNPHLPNLDRPGPETLVFAAGPYRCIGAQLATFEVEVAMRKLLEHPNIQLSTRSPVWHVRTNIAPLKELQAHFVQ